MIQPDNNGMVPCPCGAERHFARPCACGVPNPAILSPPAVAVGCRTAMEARAEADAARSAASGLSEAEIGRMFGGFAQPITDADKDPTAVLLVYGSPNVPMPRTPLGDRERGGS